MWGYQGLLQHFRSHKFSSCHQRAGWHPVFSLNPTCTFILLAAGSGLATEFPQQLSEFHYIFLKNQSPRQKPEVCTPVEQVNWRVLSLVSAFGNVCPASPHPVPSLMNSNLKPVLPSTGHRTFSSQASVQYGERSKDPNSAALEGAAGQLKGPASIPAGEGCLEMKMQGVLRGIMLLSACSCF